MKAQLIRDTETRITDTMLDAESGACKTMVGVRRVVRLSLTDAPIMVTGRYGSYRYQPELLTLTFLDGKLLTMKTWGYGIRKDGSKGRLNIDDEFSPNGERRYYRDRATCPAEIMDVVRRYAA